MQHLSGNLLSKLVQHPAFCLGKLPLRRLQTLALDLGVHTRQRVKLTHTHTPTSETYIHTHINESNLLIHTRQRVKLNLLHTHVNESNLHMHTCQRVKAMNKCIRDHRNLRGSLMPMYGKTCMHACRQAGRQEDGRARNTHGCTTG